MNYTCEEKVKIVVDIAKRLKLFPSAHGGTLDLYNEQYLFFKKFKALTNEWIRTDDCELKGTIPFEEISSNFEYHFPRDKSVTPVFVLRR